jgi:hypothetical protein
MAEWEGEVEVVVGMEGGTARIPGGDAVPLHLEVSMAGATEEAGMEWHH